MENRKFVVANSIEIDHNRDALDDFGIHTIDCLYIRDRLAASFLMKEEGRALFVENNTSRAVPLLLRSLDEFGIARDRVDYCIITHVHLDHAGGSFQLLESCPNAVLLAHPKAAKHIIDPSKLIESAKKVYGEKAFDELYGEIHPVPEERVRIIEDGEKIRFGSRVLHFFYTRGHANHHFCVHDSKSNGVFTGDSFGIAYPLLQSHGSFLFPSSTPTDFHITEAQLSIDRILNTGAERVYLTHFGEFTDLALGAEQLRKGLSEFGNLLEDVVITKDFSLSTLSQKILTYLQNEIVEKGFSMNGEAEELLRMDSEINALGILHAAKKKLNIQSV